MTYFTSDWHINSVNTFDRVKRPFASVQEMNEKLIENTNKVAKNRSDIVIHIGDLIQVGQDRGTSIPLTDRLSYAKLVEKINATFISTFGNHDLGNNKNCVSSIITEIGNERVSVSHYPSYSKLVNFMLPGKPGKPTFHICGHVHENWKVALDPENHVININVGVDVWDYKPVQDSELFNLMTLARKYYNDAYDPETKKLRKLKFEDWLKVKQHKDEIANAEKRAKAKEWLQNHPEVLQQKNIKVAP